MNKKFRPARTIAATAVALALSAASALTCGTAHANGFGEILEDFGRIVAREVHVPPPAATREVEAALGPAIVAAGENETEFTTIFRAACAVNNLGAAAEAVYLQRYTPSQRRVILNESDQLAMTSSAAFSAICGFERK